MNRGGGYTIVETMIFLGVTGVLLISAMSLMAGRQATVQFSQAVTDVQSRMQEVVGQVANGYYPNNGSFSCMVSGDGAPPTFDSTTPSVQGTSNDCVYLGKALSFNNNASNSGYDVFSLAARRLDDNDREVSSIDNAYPTPIAPIAAADGRPDMTESSNLDFGITVSRITTKSGTPPYPKFGTIIFLSTLPKFQGATGTLASGAQRVSFAGLIGSFTTDTKIEAAAKLHELKSAAVVINPPGGLVICLADGPVAQATRKAMLTIGEGASQTSVQLDVGAYDKALCED